VLTRGLTCHAAVQHYKDLQYYNDALVGPACQRCRSAAGRVLAAAGFPSLEAILPFQIPASAAKNFAARSDSRLRVPFSLLPHPIALRLGQRCEVRVGIWGLGLGGSCPDVRDSGGDGGRCRATGGCGAAEAAVAVSRREEPHQR
jgi:hypothetical protein